MLKGVIPIIQYKHICLYLNRTQGTDNYTIDGECSFYKVVCRKIVQIYIPDHLFYNKALCIYK